MKNSKKNKLLRSMWFSSLKEYELFLNAIENNNTTFVMEVLYRIVKDGDYERN